MAHERMPVVMKSELQGNTTRDKSNEAIGVDKELGIAILFVSASPPPLSSSRYERATVYDCEGLLSGPFKRLAR